MNFFRKPANLPFICGGLGLVAMGLRFWLLGTGFDEKGLLSDSHGAHWLLAPVSAAAVAAVLAAVWGKADAKRSTGMFPASVFGAAAAAAGCLGIALSAWSIYSQPQNLLSQVTWIVGAAAVFAAILLAWCRVKGLRPHFLTRLPVALYLMLLLVNHYQRWFSEPQLALYLPQLLAQVLLILNVYHRAALEANLGGRRAYIVTGQLAGFFCLMSVPGAQNALFYLTMAVWMLADAGRLYLHRKEAGEQS